MTSLLSYLGDPTSQWIWGALQALAIIVGFFFVVRQIRLARQQNSISHLIYFRETWTSPTLLRARCETSQRTPDEDGQLKGHEDVIATFMNDLGVAIRLGQADESHVCRFFGYFVEGYWLVLGPLIERCREVNTDTSIYGSFEHLFRAVQRHNAMAGIVALSPERLAAFPKEETVLAGYYLASLPGAEGQ